MNVLEDYNLLDVFHVTGPAAGWLLLGSMAFVAVAVFRLRKRSGNPISVALILLTFFPLVIGILGFASGMQKVLYAESNPNNEGDWQLNAIEALLPLRFGALLSSVFLVATLLIYAINVRQCASAKDALDVP